MKTRITFYFLKKIQDILDLLGDDDFIRYVCEDTPELNMLWEEYFSVHPEDLALAAEARCILNGEVHCAPVSPAYILESKRNLFSQLSL